MRINAISFSGKIIQMPGTSTQHPPIKQEGDTFVKSINDSKELKIKSLSEFNNELEELLKGIRRKKISPDSAAEKFITILKSKELSASYEAEMQKVNEAKEGDEPDVRALDDFYTLTFNLQNIIEEKVTNRNNAVFVSIALTPYDKRYENYCIKCSEIFGDDEELEDRTTLELTSLVEIDSDEVSEEERVDVIKKITEYLRDEFQKNPEPEFDISISIGEDYDEKKWINACTNLFKLITMTRENSQKCDKN